EPWTPAGSPGCSTPPPTRRPNVPRSRHASRTAGWSRPTRWPTRSPTSPRPRPVRRLGRAWRSTAGWPACACGRGADVQRIATVIRLRPEKEAEYRALHADAWPKVLDALRAAHVTNYSIFLRDG